MATSINTPCDPNTLSNYNNFVTTNTKTNLEINFDRKTVSGNVLLRLKSVTDAESKEVLLDSSFLNVKNVKVDGMTAKWHLLPRFEPYGSALKINLENGVENGRTCEIDVCQEDLLTSSHLI